MDNDKLIYARRTTVKLRDGVDIDDYIKVLNEKVVPNTRKQPGSVAAFVLLSEDDPCIVIGVSFWKSKKDALDSELRGAYKQQAHDTLQFIAEPPQRSGFYVLTHYINDVKAYLAT